MNMYAVNSPHSASCELINYNLIIIKFIFSLFCFSEEDEKN